MNIKINRAETCARSGLKASILNRATDRKLGKIEFDFEIKCSPNSRIVLENPNPPNGSGWNSPNFELPPGSQNLRGVGPNGNVAQIPDSARYVNTMSSIEIVNPPHELPRGSQNLSGVPFNGNDALIMNTMGSRENLNPSVELPPGSQNVSAVASNGNVALIMDGSKFMDTMSSRDNENPSLKLPPGPKKLNAVVSKGNLAQMLDGSKYMDTISSKENEEMVAEIIETDESPIMGRYGAGSKRKHFLIDDDTVTPKQNDKSIDENTGEVKGHKRRATYAGVSSVLSDEDLNNVVHRYKLNLKDEIHY